MEDDFEPLMQDSNADLSPFMEDSRRLSSKNG